MVKEGKKYSKKEFFDGCTLPDRVRAGESKRKKILGISIDGRKWNGNNEKAKDILSKGIKKKIEKKGKKAERSRLLGCVIHSIEDWYAHSYVVSVATYKRNYKKYKPTSREVKFHRDRPANVVGEQITSIEGFKSDVHIAYKDNDCQDFKNDWVDSSFNSNGRIKKAIRECVKRIKEMK